MHNKHTTQKQRLDFMLCLSEAVSINDELLEDSAVSERLKRRKTQDSR